jgi:hypothetical protein
VWLYDYPPVLDHPVATTAGLRVSWRAIPKRTYRVQYTEDWATNIWSDSGGDVLATTDTASRTDETRPTAGQRFYRVLQLH